MSIGGQLQALEAQQQIASVEKQIQCSPRYETGLIEHNIAQTTSSLSYQLLTLVESVP